MGSSSEAVLGFGYILGGEETGWQVVGADEYGDVDLDQFPWYDDEEGFDESVEKALLVAHGFTETDYNVAGYFGRRDEAKAAIGVQIMRTGSWDIPTFALIATGSKTEAEWGAELANVTVPDGAAERLAWALGVLGWRSTQDGPAWILGSFYG